MNVAQAAAADFPKQDVQTLKRHGVTFIGRTAVPASPTDVYFSATAYKLDDNGTFNIRSYQEVKIIARNFRCAEALEQIARETGRTVEEMDELYRASRD